MCEKCGPSATSIPFQDVEHLRLEDVGVPCAKCGNQVAVADASYSFQRVAFNLLYDADITRQQARQFARLVEKSNDIDWLVERSAQINPKLEQVAKIAKKEKEPLSAFKAISLLAVFLAGTPGFLDTADDLWDKYREGKLFERGASEDAHDIQDNAQDEAKDLSSGIGNDDADQKVDSGIDV